MEAALSGDKGHYRQPIWRRLSVPPTKFVDATGPDVSAAHKISEKGADQNYVTDIPSGTEMVLNLHQQNHHLNYQQGQLRYTCENKDDGRGLETFCII